MFVFFGLVAKRKDQPELLGGDMQVASEINKFKVVNSDSSPSARDVTKTSCQKRKRALSKRGEAAQTAEDRSTQ